MGATTDCIGSRLTLPKFHLATLYSVHEKCNNNLAGIPWKRGTGVSFYYCFSDGSNKKFASGKIHFQILLMWQEINQGKCETHVLLFTPICYEHKHMSDLAMLVFCFHSHMFVVYLRTTKVHSNQHAVLQKSHLWIPPMPLDFQSLIPPCPQNSIIMNPPSPSEMPSVV